MDFVPILTEKGVMTKMPTLHVLHVEDNVDHAYLIKHELLKGYSDLDYTLVETRQSYREALDKGGWNVILCDYALPDFNGHDALEMYHERNFDIPFILISGEIGEETAVEMMKAGMHDYLIKGNMTRLLPAIDREIRDAEVRREREHAVERRLEEEKKFRSMIDSSYDAILIIDNNLVIECNSQLFTLSGGLGESEVINRPFIDFLPVKQPDGSSSTDRLSRYLEGALAGIRQVCEMTVRQKNGTLIETEMVFVRLNLARGPVVMATIRDISERKKSEIELKQKMEKIVELQQQEMMMINQNPLPILLLNLNLEILKANESFILMSGYRETDLMKMKAGDFRVTDKSGHGLKEALKTKKAATGNITVEFPNGIHHIEQDIIPLLDKNNEVSSIMATYKDMTEEMRKAEEIERLIAESKERSEVLSESANELGKVLKTLASGDLTNQAAIAENDPLVSVKQDYNSAAKALLDALTEVNHVTESVRVRMESISVGSNDISRASQKVAETAQLSADLGQNLLTQIESITNEIGELSASNEEIFSTSQEVLTHSRDVASKGSDAQVLGKEANERMGVVESIASETVRDMEDLNAQIKEINKVVKMINDITGQINLLALNAAIEAARAGDAGRGFAVVAGEVKNLAADARKATDHIDEVIHGIQQSSEKTAQVILSVNTEITAGVESVNETIQALNSMVEGANQVTLDMEEIAKAIEKQATVTSTVVTMNEKGMELTNKNLSYIMELSSLAQETNAAVEEIDAAIQETQGDTEHLIKRIGNFTI